MDRAPRILRDCQCKRAQHVHGTATAYKVDQCRCEACTEANRAAAQRRRRAQLYGRHDGRVDAAPARDHLRELMAQGMGWKQVAATAGLSNDTVSAILYGKGSKSGEARQPRKRVTRRVHEAIMAVQLELAPGALVDGTGTRRRLQALIAIGWSGPRLAAKLGQRNGNFWTMMMVNNQVTAKTAAAVRALYSQLWDQTPPANNGFERRSVAQSKYRAEQAGWAPPAAWDDAQLDDPSAQPSGHRRARRQNRSAEHVIQDVEWLLDQGVDRTAIAAQLGIADDTLQHMLGRAGRIDLWRRYLRSQRIHQAG